MALQPARLPLCAKSVETCIGKDKTLQNHIIMLIVEIVLLKYFVTIIVTRSFSTVQTPVDPYIGILKKISGDFIALIFFNQNLRDT
jgi:hypothetical protein